MTRAAWIPGVAPMPAAGSETEHWDLLWAEVPPEWRQLRYPITEPPYCELFAQQSRAREVLELPHAPGFDRIEQELAWAVYTIWREGLGKITPTALRQLHAATVHHCQRRRALAPGMAMSLSEVPIKALIREEELLFEARNGRLPKGRAHQRTVDLTHRVHRLVASRASTTPWWMDDTWDLIADPRIPRREHEPNSGSTLRLGGIQPTWLREGLRYWFATSLTYRTQTWSTALARSRVLSSTLGAYCCQHGISSPVLSTDPDQLRAFALDFIGWLHQTSRKTGKPRKPRTIAAACTSIQSFYTFMFEHATEAASETHNAEWLGLSVAHTRLWPREARLGRIPVSATEPHRWLARDDLQQMVACLPILGTPIGEPVTVTLPGGRTISTTGLGDPPAMRAWLLQAMTGRRQSEILLLDYEPLVALDGIDPDNATDDTTFVARLRYQQTKVDNVDAIILVEKPVVTLIREQQQWARDQIGGRTPKYLFPSKRENFNGSQARTATAYSQALHRLDQRVQLLDAAGMPLKFTQTHRLRHTRATELINAGVPVHVVQRYLGHRGPEMTMRYAATLASVAEAEFMRYKEKVGADGQPLNIAPRDLYEMAQLDTRTDRILPNGYCLIPPTQSCGRGNACLSCGHFATDASQLDSLSQQLEDTRRLIQARQDAFTARHGQPMGPAHIWLVERNREVGSLEAIINRLHQCPGGPARGSGPTARTPETPATQGAHQTLIDAQDIQR